MFDAKFLFDFSLYHQNDVNLPIYKKLKSAKDYTRQERETLVYDTLILLKEEPPHKSLISSIPSRCVKENVSFVIDTNKLKSVNDILVDTGTWLNNGQHKFHYRKDGEKYIRVGVEENVIAVILALPFTDITINIKVQKTFGKLLHF